MASITEILTIVAIIIGILILPKMLRPEAKTSSRKTTPLSSLSVSTRFGVLATILIPIISALFFQPWKNDFILFVLTGVVPLIVGWGFYWMFAGIKNKT
ncbi:MAG: hypothetical protein GY707_04190 [Desulfobacteraceae bacterium]|nr:hypothetical protein [Desulfobacteraceae bacterium]